MSVLHRLRGDSGNAAASMIFAVLAVILIGAVVSVTVALTGLTSTVNTASSISTAVDMRYDQYVRELRAGGSPNLGSICYASDNTCVTVASATTSGTTVTLSLHAVFANGGTVRDLTRTTVTNAGTRITGFDSANNPVWGP